MRYLILIFIGIFLAGCETTNTSGGNINITGDTFRIKDVPEAYVKNRNCKYIQSVKHSNAGWSTFKSDVIKSKIKIANDVVALNATHFVTTGEFMDGTVDIRTIVSVTADIYDCKQKETKIATKPKPKEKTTPKFTEDDNKIVPAGSGSGFAISKKGHLITNFHVVEGCDLNKVHHNGSIFDANIIAVDKINDIALIKINKSFNQIFPVSEQDVALLEEVIVAGYPLGRHISSSIKTHKGVITSLSGAGDNYSNFQTDAAINQGNSGGPIINQNGNIVGIAAATWIEEGVQSVHFGIKSSTLITFTKANNLSLQTQNKRKLSNKDLGDLITSATVYFECHMTVAKIKKLIADAQNKKAIYNQFRK